MWGGPINTRPLLAMMLVAASHSGGVATAITDEAWSARPFAIVRYAPAASCSAIVRLGDQPDVRGQMRERPHIDERDPRCIGPARRETAEYKLVQNRIIVVVVLT
jgi:hypothetical protein